MKQGKLLLACANSARDRHLVVREHHSDVGCADDFGGFQGQRNVGFGDASVLRCNGES